MIETLRSVVHPWHCDVMGHLCTRHYVGFFDDAGFQLVAACGGHVGSLAGPGNTVGFVDVKASYEYQAEIGAGGLIYITSGFSRLGNSSFTARHVMRRVDDSSNVAIAEVTSVCFDLDSRKAIAMTAAFRTAAQTLMPAEVD